MKIKHVGDVGSDPVWTLKQWKEFIDDLLKRYPSDYILRTYAGYNNVSLELCKKE